MGSRTYRYGFYFGMDLIRIPSRTPPTLREPEIPTNNVASFCLPRTFRGRDILLVWHAPILPRKTSQREYAIWHSVNMPFGLDGLSANAGQCRPEAFVRRDAGLAKSLSSAGPAAGLCCRGKLTALAGFWV